MVVFSNLNEFVFPVILIKGPLEILFLIMEFEIEKVLLLSSELNKINDESPLSPVHDIFSTSILLIFTLLYSDFKIAFELDFILLNLTFSKLYSDSPSTIPLIKLYK